MRPSRARLAVGALCATLGSAGTLACTGSDGGTTTSSAAPATTVAATTSTSTTTSTTSTTTTSSTTTTTTLPFVTEGAIVLVANAGDVPGAATRLTAALLDRGFQVAEPTNAAGWEEFLEVSKIYARPGAEAVADTISRLLGGVTVLPMPTPPPIVDALVGLGDAGVLVMLGRDLAETV